MPVYDFRCSYCKHELNDEICGAEESVKCPECNNIMDRDFPAPKVFNKIIPMYPGAKKLKAGYVHTHADQPATRSQVGFGGKVSKGSRG
jgi:hypothetical protein